jgi:hypothetical protein
MPCVAVYNQFAENGNQWGNPIISKVTKRTAVKKMEN